MSGIQFVMDDKGKKTAVLIDLKKYGAVWEDFYDALIANSREKDRTISLSALKKRLKKSGKV